jgi:hypothetical protein
VLTSIGQIPHWAAARYGEATALVIGGQEISFADLDQLMQAGQCHSPAPDAIAFLK